MGLEVMVDLTLYRNNEINITLTKNIESQYCTKHINVLYHYIRNLANKKELTIKCIPKERMLADRIIKVLLTKMFRKL